MSNNSAPQKPHVNGLVFKTDIKVFPGFNFAIKGPWSKGDDEYSKKKLEGEKIVIFFFCNRCIFKIQTLVIFAI